MWEITHSEVFENVDPQIIWKIWADIEHWPEWHDDLAYCKLKGEFKAGNYFTLKPKRGPAVSILLTEIIPEKQFTDCTGFIGAKMFDTHTIEKTATGVRLINRLWVTGPLKWLWIKLVARHVAASVPKEMESLVKRAREMAATKLANA